MASVRQPSIALGLSGWGYVWNVGGTQKVL